MARYFFNVIDGKHLVDEVGAELPDMAAVRALAIQSAGELLRDEAGDLAEEEWLMYVTNEAGQTVFKLRFSAEQVDPVGRPAALLA